MLSLATLETSSLRATEKDGVAIIEIDRAPANALDMNTLEEVGQAILAVRLDPAVKVAVITSAVPRFFCAGLDLAELDADANRMSYLQYLFHEMIIMRARTTPKVFIAAITGNCLGGGMELALACDIRIAGRGSWALGLPEAKLGGFPGGGGLQLLGRLVGFAKALRLGMSGDTWTVDEAHELGVVDEVVDQEQVVEHALELARQIAAGPVKSIGAMKMGTTLGAEMGLPGALSLDRELYNQVFATEDIKEGANAFREKRPPEYKGR
jgi:enoyl-CoA hydratase/carnithine racemase